MKVVVDIPDEAYKGLMERNRWFGMEVQYCGESFASYIRCGTPLPKGCGRLGDLDALEKEIEKYSKGAFAMTPEFLVKDAQTIIDADIK